MRKNLITARKGAKLTQCEIAKRLKITLRQYQRIESGVQDGKVAMWDKLEDLFQVPQRQLRDNENNRNSPRNKSMPPSPGGNPEEKEKL